MKNVGVDLCRYEQQLQVICGSALTGICLFRKVPGEAAASEDRPARAVRPRAGRLRLSAAPVTAPVLTCDCPAAQVPAGLHVDLQLQLLATAAGASGASQTRVHHHLLIQTELEILYLPVTANILQTRPRCQ